MDEKIDIRALQGLPMPGLEVRIVNEDGDAPWDGKTMGELAIRGPWIASEYYKDERTAGSVQRWVALYRRYRSHDGEWIS